LEQQQHRKAQDNDSAERARPLWAPWRIEYIRSPKPGGCFLCEKGARGCPGDHVIHRGDTAFVLLNDFPYNSGHLMVAPYRHTHRLTDLAREEQDEIMHLLIRSQEVLQDVMQPGGFNVGFNIGDAAGAGVKDHIHGHVVPRWHGDTNFITVLADIRVVPESLEQTAQLLRDAW
jgi:ATP adenylyltransferase